MARAKAPPKPSAPIPEPNTNCFGEPIEVPPSPMSYDSITMSAPKAPHRFQPGHPGGPGNPFAARVTKLRSQVLTDIEHYGIEKVVLALLQAAENGDVAAAKLILQYAIGLPTQTIEVDATIAQAPPVIIVRTFEDEA